MKLTRSDWLTALILCVLLQTIWAVRDWANLSALHLPDTDDMMRLQQIRDWLGGQSWFDLTQHRLGVGNGLPMHWTRVNDLIPALIIVLVKPFAGMHVAELAAVLIGPAVLFFAFLVLSGRAALSLGGAGSTKTAILIAALAFPAAGMFIPGRIDHHALQIVLLLGAVTAALGAATARNGALAGAALGVSIAVGMETTPQIAALMGALLLVSRGSLDRQERALGALWGLVSALVASYLMMNTNSWSNMQCDTLTVRILALIAFPALFVSAVLRATTGNKPHPKIVLVLAGVFAVLAIVWAYPACRLGPYGQIDPFLKRVWLNHVGEAQGIFAQPHPALIWGYGALVIAAGITATWFAWKDAAKRTQYLIIGAPLLISILVMLFQLRGAYIGAGLAAPIMAQLVARARTKGTLALAGAWLLSAGVIHHLIADDLDSSLAVSEQGEVGSKLIAGTTPTTLGKSGAGCSAPATLSALNTLPAAHIIAPIDDGAYIIGGTHHSVYAGPYHRNNAGNLVMYHFFLAPPDTARNMAAQFNVNYVLLCPESFSELNAEPQLAKSLVAALKSGHAPTWLTPIMLKGSRAMLYRVGWYNGS